MADLTNVSVMTMLATGLGGVIGMIAMMAIYWKPTNKDNGEEITKILGIVFIVNLILVLMFGIAAYVYFQANTNYLTPFLLVMTFVNLFLSLFSAASSSLTIVKS